MAVAADAAGLRVSPSLDEVRELAREHTLVPLRHTFIADCETPVSAYLKLRGDGPSFLLESAEQGQRVGRWSFLGFRPRSVDPAAPRRRTRDPYGARGRGAGPLEDRAAGGPAAVRRRRRGLFGYDLVRSAEPSVGEPNPDEPGMPDLALMVTDVLLAFDHLRHEVTVLANVVRRRRPRARLRASRGRRSPRCASACAARCPARRAGARASRRRSPRTSAPTATRRRSSAAKEYIRAGDAYQVVPSQRWSADCPVDAFSIYRGLRAINPSPYMYFLDFEDFEIAGASPESLVKVTGRARRACGRSPARAARGLRRGGPRARPASCWPTRRSAPST